MSYSNQTPYLGLPIRSSSDTFNTLDNNDAFILTDQKVKEAVDNAAQATGDASDALTVANEAKTTAESAAGSIDGINATLDEHAERLVILSNRQTSQGNAIKTKAASTSIGELYDAEEGTYVVGARIVYDGQFYRCITAVSTPEDFDVAKWAPINIDSLLPSGGSVEADDVSYNDTLTQLGATDVQDAIVALKTLIDNIGGGSMPVLNFANPLHTFSSGNLSYTTTKTCYLCGTFTAAATGCVITIDDTDVTDIGSGASTSYDGVYIPPLKLNAGSVVSISIPSTKLHVFEEI